MRLPEKIRVRLLKKHSLPFSTEVNGLNSHLYQFSNKLELFQCLRKMDIKMISAQHSSNNGKNWQKLSYQKIFLAW